MDLLSGQMCIEVHRSLFGAGGSRPQPDSLVDRQRASSLILRATWEAHPDYRPDSWGLSDLEMTGPPSVRVTYDGASEDAEFVFNPAGTMLIVAAGVRYCDLRQLAPSRAVGDMLVGSPWYQHCAGQINWNGKPVVVSLDPFAFTRATYELVVRNPPEGARQHRLHALRRAQSELAAMQAVAKQLVW